MKLITHLQVLKPRMVELYIRSPKRLRGMALAYLNTGTALVLFLFT
jgi:hypothetical protein